MKDGDYIGRYYPESRFGGFTDIDGTITFYARVKSLLDPSFTVLDIGCGRGAYAEDPLEFRRNLRTLRGKCHRLIGLDVDPHARVNSCLDEFHLVQPGQKWPIETESIDLCLSDSVLEHVAEPDHFFAECRRVLRVGGLLCLRTSNRLNYIALFASLLPKRLHRGVLARALYRPKRAEDIFPTLYRCNTRRRLRATLSRHGFDHCVYTYEAEPYHLGFSRWAYWCGVMHQRFAPRAFKANLFAFARKLSPRCESAP